MIDTIVDVEDGTDNMPNKKSLIVDKVLEAIKEMKSIPGMEIKEVCYGCKYFGKLYNEWEIRNGFHNCKLHDKRTRKDGWCPEYTERR